LENKRSNEMVTLRLKFKKAQLGCLQEAKKVLNQEQDKFFIEKLGIKQ